MAPDACLEASVAMAKGASYIGVAGDESSVKIGETKERANVLHFGWCRPTCDAIKFDGVHG